MSFFNSTKFKFLFIFVCFFNFVNFINCKDEDKTCIMSDKCGMGAYGPAPCAKSTSPYKYKEKTDLDLLAELCPKLKGIVFLVNAHTCTV